MLTRVVALCFRTSPSGSARFRECSGSEIEVTTARDLLPFLAPGLLTALAPEHADGATTYGVEHRHDGRGLLTAMTTDWGGIWVVAGKDFVLEFTAHGQSIPPLRMPAKSQSGH